MTLRSLAALLFASVLDPVGASAQSCLPTWRTDPALGFGVGGKGYAATEFDDGTGPALYVGGFFLEAGGVPANRIAKWDGTTWSPLGQGLAGLSIVLALEVFDDGSGPALYVGGEFSEVDGVPALNVARWDGTSWSALADGLGGVPGAGVHALAVADVGGGPRLFAGGRFGSSGATAVSNVALWDGTAWSALGSGTSGLVEALIEFDDGGGSDLYAAGSFAIPGLDFTSYIARWDGTSWSSVGGGLSVPFALTSSLYALEVADLGSGLRLYAGGNISFFGFQTDRIGCFDGSAWVPAGTGYPGTNVYALETHDDGSGPRLFASHANPRSISEFDGTGWTTIGLTDISSEVEALASIDLGTGATLVGVGTIAEIDGLPASNLVTWGCASLIGSSLCSGDGGDQLGCTNCPCSNDAPAGTVGGCLNSAGTSARLLTDGSPSLASSTFCVQLTSATPSVFAILLSGAAVAPTNAANPCFGLSSGVMALQLDGLRCAVQGVLRHGSRATDAAGFVGVNGIPPEGSWGACSANFPNAEFVAGQTRHFQAVYREDPATVCGTGQNTSQAVSIVFQP